MLDQQELAAVKAAFTRVGKNWPRVVSQDNFLVLMDECQKEGKRVTEELAAEVLVRLMNQHKLKLITTVEEIRKILSEPQNWRYANQAMAFENEMVRRFNESPDLTNVRDYLDYLVTHGELPENPVWIEEQERKRSVHQKLKEEHGDYEVDMDAARIAIEGECQKQNLPFTFENAEFAFQKLIKDGFIKHTQAWHQAQAQDRERERIINEIVAYQLDDRGKVKPEYALQYKPKVNALRAMSFEQLKARYDEVMRGRENRKMPVEVARAAVASNAKEQRRDLYSTEAPEVEVVNPKTNRPFADRKEVVNFFKGLSRAETRAFFYFPEGRQKPGVQEVVTKILNGSVK